MRKLFLLIASILMAASMAFPQTKLPDPLWMGGEDIDCPGGAPVQVNTTSSSFRTSYAREAIHAPVDSFANPVTCTVFPGGAVTAAWLHFRIYANVPSEVVAGVGTFGTTNYVMIRASSSGKVTLTTYGTSNTDLASESGNSLNSNTLISMDMQVTGYGGSGAAVNVYVNGGATPIIAWTGTLSPGSATSFNSVFIGQAEGYGLSEIIVSTSDTRAMSLVTLAPAGAGTTNTWTSGTYANINPTIINDSSIINSQSSAQNFAATLNALPSGKFSILGVKVIARSITNGTAPTSIKPGIYSNSTVEVPSAVTLTTAWQPIETYYATNPATSIGFTMADINALQIYLASAP